MAFNGSEGEEIALEQAAAWTANHRATGSAVHAHFFGSEILQQILDQDGCVGIRIYHALDDQGTTKLVLVGVNAAEEDLHTGVIADMGTLCPPKCGTQSPLSSAG